ncbi:hypothetical protein CDAR_603591 [Caerostris darwini]|uniref:Uncharacterized protein n=1 Tax=Caerostris darwini TaxID=1538125 RepID=A0AAV4T4L9_9ARAC|nr:hypothetical protein CDAR_603591 [Caerostris darwini]
MAGGGEWRIRNSRSYPKITSCEVLIREHDRGSSDGQRLPPLPSAQRAVHGRSERVQEPSQEGVVSGGRDTPLLPPVSEKIVFFSLQERPAHQTSIPEARLAFVTEMVESSPPGSGSRDPGGDDSISSDSRVTADTSNEDAGTSGTEETRAGEDMATQVTFMKIFAPQKKTVLVESLCIFLVKYPENGIRKS